MKTVSDELLEKIEAASQTVVPKIIATFGNNRNLDNFRISSSSEFYESQIIRKSPLVYWRLNDLDLDATASTVQDHSRNGKIGTLTNTSNTSGPLAREVWNPDTETYDVPSAAMAFGTGARVTRTHDDAFDLTGDMTIMAWVKGNGSASTQAIFCKTTGPAASAFQYGLYAESGGFQARFSDGSYIYDANGGDSTSTDWQFVVGVRDGDTIRLYVDGVEVATSTITGDTNAPGAGSLAVGRRGSQANDYHQGSIGECAIFDRAISADELYCIYLAGINDGFYIGVDEFNGPYNLINIVPEETFAWGVSDILDERGETITANGHYVALPAAGTSVEEFGWCSRSETDGNGDAVNDEVILIEFDARLCSGIMLSTGYELSAVNEFEYSYKTSTGWSTPVSASFDSGSVKEIEFDEAVTITAMKIQVLSTVYPNDLMRLYEVDILYKADISEDVMSFNVQQVSENYDGTIPLGQNVSNTINLVLNNTDKKYNPSGTSDYAPFIQPDVKLDVYLGWEFFDASNPFETTYEYIKKGEFYIDNWNTDVGMTATCDGRDWSKYLMEDELSEGIMLYNTDAGYAIAHIMKTAGYPSRLISFLRTFYNQVFEYNPIAFWRLNELSGTDVVDVYNDHDGEIQGAGHTLGRPSLVNGEANGAVFATPSRGVRTWEDSQVINNNDLNLGYSIEFDEFSGNYITVPYDADFEFTDEMTVCMMISPSSFPTGGGKHSLVRKADRDLSPGTFKVEINDDQKVRAWFRRLGSSDSVELISDTVLDLNGTYFVLASFNNGVVTLRVNDERKTTTAAWTNLHSNTRGIYIAGTEDDGYEEYAGKICSVVMWDRALSQTEEETLYVASDIDTVYNFPYVYMIDQTMWDGMLEIATADIGRFYFDDDGNFIYEYRNTLHEGSLPRHTAAQYELADDTNIIGGSRLTEVQTNKVIVKVNPVTTMNTGFQQIWRAEAGESLVVSTLAEDIEEDTSEFSITDGEEPIWLSEGYLKIDNEIMSYASRHGNLLSGVVRGLYGTARETHTSGALAREARVYNIEYDQSPSLAVKRPFITAQQFDRTVDIDKWLPTSFKAELIISANTNTSEGDLIILEGEDPVTELNNYFSIAGIPLVENSSTEEVVEEYAEFENRIRKHNVKSLTIDNKFIQNKIYAKKIADFILSHFSLPDPIIKLDIHGVPQIQIHDLLEVTTFDQLDITGENYWLVETSFDYDGGVKQSVTLRKYTEPIDL